MFELCLITDAVYQLVELTLYIVAFFIGRHLPPQSHPESKQTPKTESAAAL